MTWQITAAISHLAIKPCWLVTLDCNQRTARKITAFFKTVYTHTKISKHVPKYGSTWIHLLICTHTITLSCMWCWCKSITPLPLYTCWSCQPDETWHRSFTELQSLTSLPAAQGWTRNANHLPPHTILKYPSASLLLFLVLAVWKQRIVCRTAAVQNPNIFHIQTRKSSHWYEQIFGLFY